MRIELQSKFRSRVRRLFLPASQFNVAAFLVGISRLFPRCAGVVALQLTSTRRTGTTPTKQQTLARLTGR
jgi:hypothetical protein